MGPDERAVAFGRSVLAKPSLSNQSDHLTRRCLRLWVAGFTSASIPAFTSDQDRAGFAELNHQKAEFRV